ncbi:glycine betaine ABC transporter substrate-binding protein, partial [Halobacillus trueperi]
QETLDQYPELEDVLNQLGGKITGDKMREMNYQVDFEDRA